MTAQGGVDQKYAGHEEGRTKPTVSDCSRSGV